MDTKNNKHPHGGNQDKGHTGSDAAHKAGQGHTGGQASTKPAGEAHTGSQASEGHANHNHGGQNKK